MAQYTLVFKALLDFIFEHNEINFTPATVRLLLGKYFFASTMLRDDHKYREFAVAILTGNYKGNQRSFQVSIGDPIGRSFNFGDSPEVNVSDSAREFEKRGNTKFLLLERVVEEYNNWKPKQQSNLSKNKAKNALIT